MKKPGFPGFFYSVLCFAELSRLRGLDIGRLIALGAGRLVVRHFLVFLERLEAVSLDRGEVREQILAAVIRGDEAETLCVVEPLNCT